MSKPEHVIVVGGGFSGLGVAYGLAERGVEVTLCEADLELGGLAGTFPVGEVRLEKFYHHWFTSDTVALEMVHRLGLGENLVRKPTFTGSWYSGRVHRLSTPLDLLRFSPLPLVDRLRLARLVLRARAAEDWRELEHITAREWLIRLGGERVYRVVWEPLLRGKFGAYADDIAAVWIWGKLRLRGGSRGRKRQEELLYLRGGFGRLAEAMAEHVVARGGEVRLDAPVTQVLVKSGRAEGVRLADSRELSADAVVLTLAPEQALALLPQVPERLSALLDGIPYLAAQCLVLELDRSLSEAYWLNVTDTEAPFVGVIEHTNFEPPDKYAGRHIVYLSKYLPAEHPDYLASEQAVTERYVEHLTRMFPSIREGWLLRTSLWRARYAQPVVLTDYGGRIPPRRTEVEGLWLCNMAQVYPEDRGTNYALKHGLECAEQMLRAQATQRVGEAIEVA
ncbi:MAG: NAD(P)/FAD-dependent oxidoreductase [Fimbriimonadia bacterium]